MTGFCGAFARKDADPAHTALSDLSRVAKGTLSRWPGEAINTAHSGPFFLAWFDQDIFESGRRARNDEKALAWISGDPLIVHETSPMQSSGAEHMYSALVAGDLSFLSSATGSFAAACWDKASQTLRLATDKLATRPVYVYLDDSSCVFSTSMRVLRRLIGNSLAFDEQGIAEVVFIGQCLADRTVYRNVRVLRPGEVLTIGARSEASHLYFDWRAVPPGEVAGDALCDELHHIFMDAIRRRSRSATADAFLSGGLDSRCVVAGLLDIGRRVRTYGLSPAGSADDVLGRMVARQFGTEHSTYSTNSAEWMTFPHAYIARERIFSARGEVDSGRLMWGGDGGMVLGHNYLDERSLALARQPLSDTTIRQLFPGFERRARALRGRYVERMRKLALAGIREQLDYAGSGHADRRLFLYYLLKTSRVYLHWHFEEIDRSRIEFAMPFLDSRFVAAIVAQPVAPFLHHRLYNAWITRFSAPVAGIAWQTYPGHEPSPQPLPEGVKTQWAEEWRHDDSFRRFVDKVAAEILGASDKHVRKYFSMPTLTVLRVLNRAGIDSYNYEVLQARELFRTIADT